MKNFEKLESPGIKHVEDDGTNLKTLAFPPVVFYENHLQ
jgi:hypothetical protein